MLHVYQSLEVVGNILDEAETEHLFAHKFHSPAASCRGAHTHRLQSAQSQEQAFVAGFQLNAAFAR
ncbi:Uncharacterised protein [Acinetobacter baumannii]|nr:Uncharacterised protein [Acinetobacter baumannii]